MQRFARVVGVCLAFAFVGVTGSRGPAYCHESHSHPGYFVRRKVASTRRVNVDEESRAPNLRTISGNILVVQDDGTMIENDLFVLDRVLPAFTAFLPDSFDFLNIFGSSAFADSMFPSVSEYIVRNHVAGLGMSSDLNRNAILDISTKRLKSIQLMNDIRHYGPTPTSLVPRFTQNFTGVELLGSEVMHATGCYVRLDTVLGIDILGRLNAHWSFFLSTEASVMEGCTWIDNGSGTFTSGAVLNGFSELDEYLFGLRPASSVSPMFLLDDPDSMPGGAGDASFPFPGFTTGATRVDFTIDNIVAQNGPRVPSAAASPHHFTMAFLLVTPQGMSAPTSDLLFLEQFRLDWESFFALETESLGSMATTLPLVPATASFMADRIAGTPPLDVQFLAEPEGTVNALFWDFGDSSPLSSQPHPLHTYANPGVYNSKLTVLSSGQPSVVTRTIRVGNFPALVHEDFEAGPSGWQLGAPNSAPAGPMGVGRSRRNADLWRLRTARRRRHRRWIALLGHRQGSRIVSRGQRRGRGRHDAHFAAVRSLCGAGSLRFLLALVLELFGRILRRRCFRFRGEHEQRRFVGQS